MFTLPILNEPISNDIYERMVEQTVMDFYILQLIIISWCSMCFPSDSNYIYEE